MMMREERKPLSPPKKKLYSKLEVKRPRQRPRARWIDQIRKDMEIRGGIWGEIQEFRKLDVSL